MIAAIYARVDEKRDKRDRDPEICVTCNRGEHEKCRGGDCQCRCEGRLRRKEGA
ncbi:MAG TPA: hypothetical protein VE932_04925 [Patescibacteria group bacterium]|nr:hypothetical protein [Patescibacteria group bacterium]